VPRTLIMLFGPMNGNYMWRTRYNNEMDKLYDELDVVQMLQVGRLRRLGHLFRTQEMDSCRKRTLLKPEGAQRVGNTKLG